MNRHLIFPLILAVCPAIAEQAAPNPVQRFEQARLEYEALQTLAHIRAILSRESDELLQPVNQELFLQAFRAQLSTGGDIPFERLAQHARQRQKHIDAQIKAADFLTPHAAQAGVTVLPNGLQYATFSLPVKEQNYKARRAHDLQACVPGTELHLSLMATPTVVDDALYEVPRGIAWQFLMPVELLDTADAASLKKAGIHTIEILAVRESLSDELRQQAKDYFAGREPKLPAISLETPELHAERSRLMGMLVAAQLDEPSDLLLKRVEELLARTDMTDEMLEDELSTAATRYDKAREELRRMQHRQIAADIMQFQRQLPGTIILSNGILCRAHSGSTADIPFMQARYIEEEELGSEMYLRVRDRIINAQNDLPQLILQVQAEIPVGSSWELIIPPNLRPEHEELPMLYRIRATRPQTKKQTPLLPDTV